MRERWVHSSSPPRFVHGNHDVNTDSPFQPAGQRSLHTGAPDCLEDPTRPGRISWAAYLLAAGITLATLWARVAVGSRLEGPTMIVFTIPIILSAYWGGLGPGLLASVLSGLGAAYLLLPPIYSFQIVSPTHRWQ